MKTQARRRQAPWQEVHPQAAVAQAAQGSGSMAQGGFLASSRKEFKCGQRGPALLSLNSLIEVFFQREGHSVRGGILGIFRERMGATYKSPVVSVYGLSFWIVVAGRGCGWCANVSQGSKMRPVSPQGDISGSRCSSVDPKPSVRWGWPCCA